MPNKCECHKMTFERYQAAEVDWYRKHGRFQGQRIAFNKHGREYVIGDAAFNAAIHRERIEPIPVSST